MERAKRNDERSVLLRNDESSAENSSWQMNAEARLGAEAKLQALNGGWLWD